MSRNTLAFGANSKRVSTSGNDREVKMKRQLTRTAMGLAFVSMLFLAGCTTPSAPTATTEQPQAAATTEESTTCGGSYEYVTMLSSIDYFTDAKNGLAAAERDFGVETNFSGPTDNDMNGLIQAIDQAIARQPDGLILLGWSTALFPSIEKAQSQGIPVALVNTDFPESGRAVFIGANNTAWGFTMGTVIKEAVGSDSKILVVRDPGLSNVTERFEGLKAAIASEPGLEIVADVNDQSDTAKATQAVTTALLANPDVNTVVALTGVAGPAAVTAIREAGLTGKVQVFAVNRDQAILQGVQDGDIYAAFAEHPQVEAYQAIALLQQQACGSLDISNNDDEAGITSLPNGVDSGVTSITQENAAQFLREQ